MRLSSKHAGVQPLVFGDFSGGLRCDIAPNSVQFQPNMLQKATNVEIDYITGKLKVVDGLTPVMKLPAAADTLFYNYKDNYFLTNCGRDVYRLSGYLSGQTTPTKIGQLNGIKRPDYTVYDQHSVIVSGNRVQYCGYADSLTALPASPPSSLCHVRGGRLYVANPGSPRVTMCGVNDITNWNITSTNEQDAWYAEIAPGTGGIIAMRQLAGNIVIVKDSGKTYRFVGDHYTLFNAYDGPEGVYTVGQAGVISVENNLYYVGRDGFSVMSFASGEYGALKTAAVGAAVNVELLRGISQKACLWDVAPKKQIWVRADDIGNTYLYHYGLGIWTKRKFSRPIADVCLVGNMVYILADDTVYKLDKDADTELDGLPIQVDAEGKLYTSMDEFLVKRIAASVDANGDVSAKVSVGRLDFPIQYTANSPFIYDQTGYVHDANYPIWTLTRNTPAQKRQVYRCKEFSVQLTSTKGTFSLNEIKLDVVGV